MSLSVLSVVGVALLGGGVAVGLTALVVAAVGWLVAVGLVNAIRLLGEFLEAVDDGAPPLADDGASRR
jgi:hypothetical protein